MKNTIARVGKLDSSVSIEKGSLITADVARPNSRLIVTLSEISSEGEPEEGRLYLSSLKIWCRPECEGQREGGVPKELNLSGWDIDMLLSALDQLRPEIAARYPKK